MKVKKYSCLIITLVVFLFISCDKSNDIIIDDEYKNNEIIIDDEHKSNEKTIDYESLSVSIHRLGGFMALDEKLIINEDSTHYSIRYFDLFGTSEFKSYQTTIETSDELWDYLTKNFDLDIFTKIGDGSCSACLDGIDEVISVIIDGETYSFYNGVVDEHYQQMQKFFDSLFIQLDDFEIIAKYRE